MGSSELPKSPCHSLLAALSSCLKHFDVEVIVSSLLHTLCSLPNQKSAFVLNGTKSFLCLGYLPLKVVLWYMCLLNTICRSVV